MYKYAEWQSGFDDVVRGAWTPKTGRRYSDFLYMRRMNEEKKVKQDFIPDEVLKNWKKYWKSDEFRVKSVRASKNRNSGEGGPSKHSGGSITFRTHRERMSKEMGKDVSAPDVY